MIYSFQEKNNMAGIQNYFLKISHSIYHTRAIISRGLYFFLPHFHCGSFNFFFSIFLS